MIWFYAIAVCVVIVDQITKYIARASLQYGQPVRIIPGFLDLKLDFNKGAAFGMLPDWAPLLIIVGLVAVFALVKLGRANGRPPSVMIGLGLLLGGAIGNLIDRIAFRGQGVTDFMSLHITLSGQLYAWPTFNFADMAIVIGAIIVVFRVYVIGRRETEEPTDQGPSE